MINSVCGTGSTGRICTDLAERLEADGHDCLIAYGRCAVPEQYRKYAIRIGSKLDVCLHGVQARLFDHAGFGSKRATKADVWKMQREVSLLVNPRQNTENFTKYSFPSKTMEYLSSGTPVLMYRLDGIPKEYDEYLHYVSGNNVQDLTSAIKELLNCDSKELDEKAYRAQKFIMSQKNAVVQSAKILNIMQITKNI